ncbi:MAG: 2-amino-4-hydroxy-6-hydroxymethyldihydropteridine diphosphokinase [Sedimenticolaceae bacterium]
MNAAAVTAFVGLGSNLGKPVAQVREAMRELDELPHTRRISQSRLYHSSPLGPAGQPPYVNAVAMLHTTLDPGALLAGLHDIEQRHGRLRNERWGPRTLDLDLLLYGDQQIETPRLRVPHPELHRRDFVLVPLFDIAPDLYLPGLGPLADYVESAAQRALRPVASADSD